MEFLKLILSNFNNDKRRRRTGLSSSSLSSFLIVFFCLSSCSLLDIVSGSGDIVGCGGYVKSPYKLDLDKIEIKLFTKQGSLRLKTECAPNGYYFIPLEAHGDYVLRVSPPEGWTFTPSEVEVHFDDESDDPCSRGEDVNFVFKGFSVLGKVLSSGFTQGPEGVGLRLTGPDNLVLTSESGPGGVFHFDSIPPGPYSLKATSTSLKFDKDSFSFEIINKNVIVDGQLVVSGYEVSGAVKSDGTPVEGVTLVLVGGGAEAKVPKGCAGGATKMEGITLPADVKGKILCTQNSDKSGSFKFSGVAPGDYLVVPVYRGTNTVYNVSPERQAVSVGHRSLNLDQAFEVEGFTIQGKVKGHSGARVMVNGQLKATSGHDGSFTIPKMKPGTYEFEILAEKFLFDKKKITIQPTDHVLPNFVPSKFQMCGTVSLKSRVPLPEITLVFKKTPPASEGQQKEIIFREKVTDLSQACVFLPEGSYSMSVESHPERYFVPEKTTIQVPSGSRFSFEQFSGNIGGKADCKLSSCDGVKVRVENRDTGVAVQEIILSGTEGGFSFENLESGDYRIKIDNERICWKSDVLDLIQLKNSHISNLQFLQVGVPLEVRATHPTSIKIVGATESATQTLQLDEGGVKKICLGDPNTPPESYKIIPFGCHTFEKSEYSFVPGQVLGLVAVAHEHTWTVSSSFPIDDLKIDRNGESHPLSKLKQGKGGVRVKEIPGQGSSVQYEVTSIEVPGNTVEWQVFSFGFIFEPSNFRIDTHNDCKRNLLNVVAKQSHVIKGKLSLPLEDVEIRIELVGDPDASVFVSTNAEGEYIAGPFIHSSGFKVTPTLVGYTFKPLDKDPYSFTVMQLAKIHVRVGEGDEGVKPVGGVLLSLSGPGSYRQNKVTAENGEMVFPELEAGQYYLKALLKEFTFQPSAINIELQEQEMKGVRLNAIRESFSLYGHLSSLSGEVMPDLLVTARGVGNCSEYGEEATSDKLGNFRIWALKSYCVYKVSVITQGEHSLRVERTIPSVLNVNVGVEDIHNISFVVITPVRRMDVSLRVFTNNEKSLDHLKAIVSSSSNPEQVLHSTPFNGISYIILPPIPKDDDEYSITFESSLNRYQYNFKLPQEISFTADRAYAHFNLDFTVEPAPVDQDIGKSSYVALAMIIVAITVVANYERLAGYVKDMVENYTSSVGKKVKSKAK